MNRSLSTNTNRDLNLWDVFDRIAKDFDMPIWSNENHFTPKIEVKDLDHSYQVCAEVPGMDEKDINVTLKENNLVIEGERKSETKQEDKKKGLFHSEMSYGRFYRSVPLSDDIDVEKVNASYKNGLLTVELAKHPGREVKERKIPIGSNNQKNKQQAIQ